MSHTHRYQGTGTQTGTTHTGSHRTETCCLLGKFCSDLGKDPTFAVTFPASLQLVRNRPIRNNQSGNEGTNGTTVQNIREHSRTANKSNKMSEVSGN